jgi:RNA polymerase sigma-70 factor, ECF subfamily
MAEMAALIRPIIPALRRYARTFVCDAEVADDLVQDTLERAISRWHQRRSDGNLRRWLFIILHNLAMNHLLRLTRRVRELPLDDAHESEMVASSTQEDALRHADILAAVEQLPEDQRCILLLVSVEDVSYADAARILNIPIGTVMSRLARARARLLKLVEEQGNPTSGSPCLRRVQESPSFDVKDNLHAYLATKGLTGRGAARCRPSSVRLRRRRRQLGDE